MLIAARPCALEERMGRLPLEHFNFEMLTELSVARFRREASVAAIHSRRKALAEA